MGEMTDDEVIALLTTHATRMGVDVAKFVKAHPLNRSELGGLVSALGVAYFVEMEAQRIAGIGDTREAMEFRALMLKPLRRAVGLLQGPTN